MVEKIRRRDVTLSLATVVFCFGAGFVSVAGGQANDLCQNATLLTVPSFTSDCTIGALFDVVPECDGVINDSPGIWYKVIGTGNEITASLCSPNTDYDTKLSVYCSGCADSKCIAANDDFCDLTSEVTWCSAVGVEYLIMVHGFAGASGCFDLTLSDGAFCPLALNCKPTNNNCANAMEIGPGLTQGDNISADTEVSVSCQVSNSDVWYRFTPGCSGVATIKTCGTWGTLADTVLTLFDQCGGQELACNDDSCGLLSQITIPLTAGRSILIRVADYGSDPGSVNQGTFELMITMLLGSPTVAPPGFYVTASDGPFDDHLLRLDVQNNTFIDIGPLGISTVWGLAYNANLGVMYGVSPITDQLVTINLTTGAATPLGTLGSGLSSEILAFDTELSRLYGIDGLSSTHKFLAIDPVTGSATHLLDTSAGFFEALAFEPGAGTLYGLNTTFLGFPEILSTIDTSSGLVADIGSLGGDFDFVTGLAFEANTGELYGTQLDANSFAGRLIQIDKATGAATQLGQAYAHLAPGGFEIVPGLPDVIGAQAYSGQIPIAAGCPPYTVTNATGLPDGLNIDSGGLVTGVTTRCGDYVISFDVADINLSTPPISTTLPLRVLPASQNDSDHDGVLDGCDQMPGCYDGANVILDNIINLPDYAILSAEYGCTIGCAGDVNGDGKTDLVDVIIMANNWLCVGTN